MTQSDTINNSSAAYTVTRPNASKNSPTVKMKETISQEQENLML
jgi:hypothetical protein